MRRSSVSRLRPPRASSACSSMRQPWSYCWCRFLGCTPSLLWIFSRFTLSPGFRISAPVCLQMSSSSDMSFGDGLGPGGPPSRADRRLITDFCVVGWEGNEALLNRRGRAEHSR